MLGHHRALCASSTVDSTSCRNGAFQIAAAVRPRAQRSSVVVVRAGKERAAAASNSQQQQPQQQQQQKQPQTVVAVDPTSPTAPIQEARGPPVAVLALAAVAAAAVGAVAFKRLRGGAGAGGADPFEREVLRNVNMVRVDELSEEAIAVARARRQRESAYLKMDLQEVELPENHPWAVKKPVTEEQEAEIAARLSVRRAARRLE